MQNLIAKAATLLEALPYIQRFSGATFVVKYGGSFMDSPNPETRNGVARDIVFLEAVELEEIGEFEGADVATGMADFPLKIAHDLGQVSEGKAGAEELEPEPLPVKAQGKVLTGEMAIGLVQLL